MTPPASPRPRFLAALVLGLGLALLVSSGPAGSRPDVAPRLSTSPFEAASAAGERLLLKQAGLLPAAVPTKREARASAPTRVWHSLATPGVDIQVNNSADDTGESTTQSETTLAVDGDIVCAGYNEFSVADNGLSGLSRSADGGATWNEQNGLGGSGDPVLALDEGTNTFYYAELATIGGNTAIGVASSTDGCQTFGAAVDAGPAASAAAPFIPANVGNRTTLNDKPWIAVDNTGGANDGNIYICWTRFIDTSNPSDVAADTSELRLSRSTNGGTTFVNEQVLAGTNGTAPFGCSIDVGPNGNVHLVWADRAGATQGDIRYSVSTDGGQNYAAPVSISTGNRAPGTDRVVACGTQNRTTLVGNIRMLHQAWLAVDESGGPFDGNLYVVWASDPVDGGMPLTTDHSDVFFSRSTNGGAIWSAAVQLGGGGGATDQFEPFVEVAGAGAVSVAWYDKRNDAANNLNVDVYKAFSDDGGATFGAIQRVTAQSFGVTNLNPHYNPGTAQCYMGEYIAIASDERNFYYAWGDNRNTIFTTNFPAPTGRLDADVFFELEVAPVVNDADLAVTKADAPDPVVAGTNLTYTIDVDNNGPDIALDVEVTDTLPAGVTFVSDTSPDPDGDCAVAGQVLTCELGDMASGDSITFTITVTVAASQAHNSTITNTASVDGVANDANAANDSDSENTQVIAQADLEIVSATVLGAPAELLVAVDQQVTLRKVLRNNGPSSPMDAVLTANASASAGASVLPAVKVTNVNDLAVGTDQIVDEVFTVRCNAESDHTFTFTNSIAPAAGAGTDPNLANNTGEVVVDIECIVPVKINIKPGSFPNSININGGTSVTVAILTTAAGEYGLPLAFDASTVDASTVRFGPPSVFFGGGASPTKRGKLERSLELDEKTRDADLDLIVQFRADETGLHLGDTVACVKGDWVDGGGATHSFFGCDSVRIVRE